MADSASVLCEGCEYKSLTNNAEVWCNDCDEGLCNECVKGHEITKSLRAHHIISIQDHLSVKDDIVETVCPKHNRKIEKFCLSHDALLCVKCVQSDHCKCEDLLEIDEAAKGVKSSTALANLEESSNVVVENIDGAFKNQKEDLKSLEVQEEQIKERIDNERSKMNAHLDLLQSKLLYELNLNSTNAKADINASGSRMAVIKHRVCKLQDQTARQKRHAPEKETFIAMKTAERCILEEKAALKQEIGKLATYTLDLDFSSKFQSVLTAVNEMGHVKLIKKAKISSFKEPLLQAQGNPSSSVNSIHSFELMNTKVVNIPIKDVSLRDGVFLGNGMMVFADYANNRLIYYNEAAKLTVRLSVEFIPEYMAFVKNNMVVAGGGLGKDLFFINANNTQTHVTRSKHTGHRGLSFNDGKIYRVGKHGKGSCIFELDMEGNELNIIPVDEKTWKIAVQGELIYYTIFLGDILHCCDRTGKTIWSFKHDVIKTTQYSASIALDNQNNVFVLGSGLLVLSPCGKHFKVLLTSSELNNLTDKHPTGLFYENNTNQLLLTFMSSQTTILLNVGN